MSDLISKFTKSYRGQLFIVLVLFIILRVLSVSVFYNGFLFNFERLGNFVFGGRSPSLSSHSPFHSWSIIVSALLNPLFFVTLLLFYGVIYFRSSKDLYYKTQERILLTGSSVLLAWELCTYDYNYYLDNGFYFDRIFLLLMSVLVWRFRVLIPFFVASAFVYRSQFNYPVDGYALFDKRLLFDLLLMYLAYFAVFRKIDRKVSFVFLALCIVGANYFMSGIKKLTISPHGIEWMLQNDLSDLFLNVHYKGWMANVSSDIVTSLATWIGKYSVILQILIFTIEFAGLFLLKSRKTAIVLLILFAFLHVGIFIFGSMFFWKWIVIDILLLLICIFKKESVSKFFTSRQFYASLVVISTSLIWLKPYMIGWHDTSYIGFFSYEVITEKGDTLALEKNDLDPFHQWFQFDDFWFLVNENHLRVGGFGYTNSYDLKKKIKEAGPEGIPDLERLSGRNDFDQRKKEIFEVFVKKYFQAKNRKENKKSVLTFFAPPHHLHNSSYGKAFKDGGKVKYFRITLNKIFTINQQKIQLTKKVVDTIEIPQ